MRTYFVMQPDTDVTEPTLMYLLYLNGLVTREEISSIIKEVHDDWGCTDFYWDCRVYEQFSTDEIPIHVVWHQK